ncbi:MAG: hypothetical protein AAGL89_16615 [Pseudomonadota bacterium]
MPFVVFIALICGTFGGLGSALIVFFSGYGVLLAFLAYSLGGALSLLLTAALLARRVEDDSL